jgi:predicted nucleic acid-binding protein
VSRKPVLLDTSVLVAMFLPGDAAHQAVNRFLFAGDRMLVTCWPVIAEACHLLRRVRDGRSSVLRLCASEDVCRLAEISRRELMVIDRLAQKYADQSPDLADACLIHLLHRDSIDSILTLDSDFRIYRTTSGKSLEVLPDL